MPHIFEVGELTRAVREVLESQFPFVWVRGEVGGVSRPASGHLYFSLKDGQSRLPVVWFRRSQRCVAPGGVDPRTGEVLEHGCTAELTEGASVLVAGRLSVFEPQGAYQLVAELVQEQGAGQLAMQFEAMKARLAGLGYFDPGRKRPLPPHPARVAVVTAPTGAAVRDFLRLAGERGWGCAIRIYPTLVQGEQAPARVAAALDAACADGWAEVVALIRGGGSLEDLWAFNTEPVAAAVFRASLPVVCGVGHEVDTSIADLVADVRAATPSHAAQLLWPERGALMQRVDVLEQGLFAAAGGLLERRQAALGQMEKALRWLSPAQRLARMGERLDTSLRDLLRAGAALTGGRSAELARCEAALGAAFGPRAVARRRAGLRALALRLPRAARALLRQAEAARALERRLALAGPTGPRGAAQALALLESRLGAVDPEAPLARGYGLVRVAATGRLLRGAAEAAPGQELDIRMADGVVGARVLAVRPGADGGER
ncbi:exodeoxyribonuclease VII large subunit [Desulfocurvus sp.]|uniref:exodeoxyribonuclease VII large subunit n=1 Tax=Desulfocurvus sp. TaxID=2871698 RepID=UPI0025BCA6F3|nr:exodeoxyribonuclease VII large subunit [Desulfocurvus sp.]MCK9239410.1 exodeoxyribonuclease VII large subunit [Desulfocurvus sp.]